MLQLLLTIVMYSFLFATVKLDLEALLLGYSWTYLYEEC